MRPFTLLTISAAALVATIFAFGVFTLPGRAAEAPPDAANVPSLPEPSSGEDVGNGSEVLTRGPVHEAYATPLEFNPQPGPVLKQEPPRAIDEVPPDQKPEGDNVIWIPGYFAWDDERGDYLWVSGVWRNIPPGQTWVAGYWNKVADGYQWTPGFWTGAKTAEVNYQAVAPPATLETGPSSPQPSDNHFWIPGTWVYQDRYAWQPGYWAVTQPNWVWTPAHWMWTPGGYVFVAGYWDYAPAYRGCLFAPVYFSPVIYARPHFVWCPGVVINVGFLSANLFCGPRHCNYYFGDYYSTQCAGLGFRPFFEVSVGRRVGYDPLFNYYRWKNRTDPNWVAQQKQHFETLQKNSSDRPPATFVAQKEWMQKNGGSGKNSNIVAATTLAQAAKDPGTTGFKMHNVSMQNRQEMLTQAQTFNKFSKERSDVEKQNLGAGGAGTAGGAGGASGAAGRGTAGNTPQKLKLPTITTIQTKGSGGTTQALSQQGGQTGQTGDAGAGQARNKFNRQQMSGVTGQDQGTAGGKPNLLDKTQSNEQDKTMNQGKPFGQIKPLDQDKTSDQNQQRSTFVPRTGAVVQPGGGQNADGSGKPNMTLVPKSAVGGNEDQGGSKPNSTMGAQQGQGGGGAGGQGNANKVRILYQQGVNQGGGGGGGGVGGGGGSGQQRSNTSPSNKKDKDDPDQQQNQRNKNRSDNTSPRTNFSMERNVTPGLDAGRVVEAEKKAVHRDVSNEQDNWAKDALNDKLTNDKPAATPAARSAGTKTQSSQSNGSNGLALPGTDNNGKQALGSNDKGVSNGPNSPSSGLSSAGPGTDARTNSGPTSSSPGSMSIYRNLQDRGRSLSQPSTAGDKSDVDARLKKDPIGSYSYGSSPSRYPGISAPYAAGAQGATAQGASAGGGGGGLGGIQHFTPGGLPKLEHGVYNNSATGPAANASDPAARTYDPNQQSTNSYGR